MIIFSLEIPAVIMVLTNTYLIARASPWNWLFGMVAVTLYAIIFSQHQLYGVMCLQIVFLLFQFYGVYEWLYGGKNHTPLAITRLPRSMLWVALLAVGVLFGGGVWVLQHYTHSSVAYLDAAVTACSLVAQWMMCKKWLEHWLLWMVNDLIAIKLYLVKQLYFTSGLYAVLFLLCCYGYYHWRHSR